MIGSVTSQGDQAVDIGLCSLVKMVSHFVGTVGNRHEELSEGIVQPFFNLLKHRRSATFPRMRIDDDQRPHFPFPTLPSLLKSLYNLRICLGRLPDSLELFNPCEKERGRFGLTFHFVFHIVNSVEGDVSKSIREEPWSFVDFPH